jgi:hypothetical protein
MNHENHFDTGLRLLAERRGVVWIDDLKHIYAWRHDQAREMTCLLLESACKAQQTAIIDAARRRLTAIPSVWLNEHLIECAKSCISFEDEWEMRRLLEFASVNAPIVAQTIAISCASSEIDVVREVAEDFLR